jgi:hypothetical protein
MFRSIDLRTDLYASLTIYHAQLGKAWRSLAAACQCFVLFTMMAPTAFSQQVGVSIDSFNIIKIIPEAVDIELVGSNDGSLGPIDLKVISKSKDGSILSRRSMPVVVPIASQLHIRVQVLRPQEVKSPHAEFLVIWIYQRSGTRILTRKFDWPFIWPELSANSSGGAAEQGTDGGINNSGEVFGENLREEDFAALDALLEKWNKPEERDQDGLWKLIGIWDACYSLNQGKGWKESLHYYEKWREFNLESPGAAIAESNYWAGFAWSIRGGETNSEADPVAMKIFTERMERAEQILIDSRKSSSNNPLWYDAYLSLAIATKRDDKFTEALFDEGISKHPYYQPLYFKMAKHWAPRSGENANWRKVEDVVNRAVALTSGSDGTSNYARLYSWVSNQQKIEFNLFQDSLVSWPKMRNSFEELVKRYPSPNNLNEYAVFACRAGDKDAYLKVRVELQGRVLLYKWPTNYSLDVCDHIFMQSI